MLRIASVDEIRAIEKEADAKGYFYSDMMDSAGRAAAAKAAPATAAEGGSEPERLRQLAEAAFVQSRTLPAKPAPAKSEGHSPSVASARGEEFPPRPPVITPESPLGKQIMGRKKGDRFQLEIAGTRSEYRVVSIQ